MNVTSSSSSSTGGRGGVDSVYRDSVSSFSAKMERGSKTARKVTANANFHGPEKNSFFCQRIACTVSQNQARTHTCHPSCLPVPAGVAVALLPNLWQANPETTSLLPADNIQGTYTKMPSQIIYQMSKFRKLFLHFKLMISRFWDHFTFTCRLSTIFRGLHTQKNCLRCQTLLRLCVDFYPL